MWFVAVRSPACARSRTDIARRRMQRTFGAERRRSSGSIATSSLARLTAKLPPSFDQLAESGHAIAGAAGTVAQMLSDQVSLGGVNYVIGSFMFGSIPHVEAMASIRRFAEDVMPAVKATEAVAA